MPQNGSKDDIGKDHSDDMQVDDKKNGKYGNGQNMNRTEMFLGIFTG